MPDVACTIRPQVAFALGNGAGGGARKAGMVDHDHAPAGHAIGRGTARRVREQRPQPVEIEGAGVEGVVEGGPMALHHQAQFRRAVRARRLGHGVDEVQQRRWVAGGGLIQCLSELRYAFECVHTRKSARSCVVSQGSLL